jgi:copper resistance protein C
VVSVREETHMDATFAFRRSYRRWRTACFVALFVCSIAAWSSLASAHSVPLRFEPPRDAVLPSAPAEVRIVFDGDIEPAFSSIQVTDSAGRRVDNGDARVVDARYPRVLRVWLGRLPPGVYRVRWHIFAIDGHRSEGTYVFTLRSSE